MLNLITILTEDKLNEVETLIDEYTNYIVNKHKLKRTDAYNSIIKNLKDNNNNIHYVYFDDSKPVGIIGGRKEPNLLSEAYLTTVFISENTDSENIDIQLFKKIFKELSRENDTIRIMGYQPSIKIQKILEEYNFQRFDRHYMSISRDAVENLPNVDLPDEFEFDTWNEGLHDDGIEIMIDAHTGSIDNLVFGFFGNQSAMKIFMKYLENHRWGKFKPTNTTILKHKDKAIGLCFMTILGNGNGYIPDFALKREYKGKGLGKALFNKSMKIFLENEPESKSIDLDVTKENPIALNIYKKNGFTIQRDYSVYTWNKS